MRRNKDGWMWRSHTDAYLAKGTDRYAHLANRWRWPLRPNSAIARDSEGIRPPWAGERGTPWRGATRREVGEERPRSQETVTSIHSVHIDVITD